MAQNGLNFDGVNDRVICGNGSSVQLSGTKITLEAWIYPTAWQPQVFQGNIINKENNAPDYGYMLRCGENGRLNFNLGDGSWHERSTPANTLSLNTWQHVAATYDGSKMRLYLNGNLVDSISITLSFTSSLQNLTLGNWSNPSTARCFIGSIDEARVWNIARSKAQIQASMNGELCSPETGLVACYRLNEGIAGGSNAGVNTTSDFSPNNNNGTLSGFSLSGSTSNWVSGAGLTPGSSFMQVTASGCNEYTGPGGVIYDSTGVYLDTLQSVHGCDSVIQTNLTLKYVDVAVTATATSLTANQNLAAYKWMDCNDNYKLVSGGTNQTLFPPDPNGSYAVQVDFGGCIDTSDCYSLQGVGLDELRNDRLSVYPNPGRGLISISHPGIYRGQLKIYNSQGRLVCIKEIEGVEESDLNLGGLPTGWYQVVVANDEQVYRSGLLLE